MKRQLKTQIQYNDLIQRAKAKPCDIIIREMNAPGPMVSTAIYLQNLTLREKLAPEKKM